MRIWVSVGITAVSSAKITRGIGGRALASVVCEALERSLSVRAEASNDASGLLGSGAARSERTKTLTAHASDDLTIERPLSTAFRTSSEAELAVDPDRAGGGSAAVIVTTHWTVGAGLAPPVNRATGPGKAPPHVRRLDPRRAGV
jgi:hypothetical protein